MTRRLATAFSIVFLPLFAVAAVAQSKGGQPAATSPTPPPVVVDAPPCIGIPQGNAAQICSCGSNAPVGSVWGSNPYTGDSSICTAARHAGVIGPGGGLLKLIRRPGQASYDGTAANGVTTGSWGSYGESFEVLATNADTTESEARWPACPGTLGAGVEALDCSCAAGLGDASVWGSDPYTADSGICTAARHAGYIDAGGGNVRVMRIRGLDSYAGSESNGVTSADWNDYESSIIFNWN